MSGLEWHFFLLVCVQFPFLNSKENKSHAINCAHPKFLAYGTAVTFISVLSSQIILKQKKKLLTYQASPHHKRPVVQCSLETHHYHSKSLKVHETVKNITMQIVGNP